MFEKIIVATDLSKASYALIDHMGSLKEFGTQEVLLVQFLSNPETTSVALTYSKDGMDKNLKEQKEILERKGFTVDTRTLEESAKNEINKIAESEDYSVIVVGAENENMMKARMFGSYAYDVIRFAQKPILMIRLLETRKNGKKGIDSVDFGIGNKILFPTDFSENAGFAFDHLKMMIDKGVRKVTLMHIQDKSKIMPHLSEKLEEFNKIDAKRLEDMKKMIEDNGNVEVDTVIRFGSPTIEILNFVEEEDIKLVVMGSQGRGFVKELFVGSVSNNVVRKSNSSVLLIPAHRK